ncbi:hypothetical protein MycrhDRAFT_5694 [Mycolicibacterium rhodesiae JS60]|nr:hypothetical protein MycrhDRAFT_5694 [Mycolicibacterium rhodesiae JS60]
MARKNDDFTTKADELLDPRRSTLHPFDPPAGVTLQPLDLPGAMADPARQAHGTHRQTTSENAPAAATGDGAPRET